jgi:GT2 family glycosyltransferase
MEKDEGQYKVQSEIFWASGACLFIRTALFREMNGFDEDLFSHQEEIDLCWRLKSTGYKIMYCPASEVMHFGGGMLPKTNPHKTFLNFRNNLIIICKNYKGAKMGQVLFIRFILDILAAFRYLFIGNTGDFCAVIKAQWQFTTGIPKTLKKRHLLNNSPNALISCIYKHSIVRKYFIQHIRKFSLLDKREFTG